MFCSNVDVKQFFKHVSLLDLLLDVCDNLGIMYGMRICLGNYDDIFKDNYGKVDTCILYIPIN